MSEKKDIYKVEYETYTTPFTKFNENISRNDITIEKALDIIIRQLKISGARVRTVYDYSLIVKKFIEITEAVYLIDINNDVIYKWLGSMDVSNQTKLTRLKCLKAFLGRCFDNGWIEHKFWKTVHVKVDQKIKEGATDKEVDLLMSLLDFTNFIDLRNGTAVLLMYRCGIRIATLSKLKERHIDFENKTLNLDGELMKNHMGLKIPFDDQLSYLLFIMIKQNKKIRAANQVENDYVFITRTGGFVGKGVTSSAIQKQLNKYTNQYQIKNINPHALRRGFATNLLKRGADINLISKALGHSDLGVTTQYLSIDVEETLSDLRRFL